MSNKLVQIHFDFHGPFGAEMSSQLVELAESINLEPGFIWKIWTESPATGEAGGIYLFADRASAEAYLAMYTARLKSFGITPVNGWKMHAGGRQSKTRSGGISKSPSLTSVMNGVRKLWPDGSRIRSRRSLEFPCPSLRGRPSNRCAMPER